jgi:hypothetical protein
LRQDLLNAKQRRIRIELASLRRLGRDRRIASTRLPTMTRTGPTAPDKRKELAR